MYVHDLDHQNNQYNLKENFAPKSVLPPPKVTYLIIALILFKQHMGHKWLAYLKKKLRKFDNAKHPKIVRM